MNVVSDVKPALSPSRTVWKLAWPTITEQCLNLTVGLNEVFLLGHLSVEVSQRLGYVSATALTASSLGQFFNWIVFAGFNGVGIATTALVARSIGAKENAKATDYARHGMIIAFIFGLFMATLMYFVSPLFLTMLGATDRILELGTAFARTTCFGMPLFAVMVAGNASLRGSGDTRSPLTVMLIINLINIAVAWVFINGSFGMPTLGVEGAALGAVVSWTVGSLLVISRLFWGLPLASAPRTFRLPLSFRLENNTLRAIIGQALPTIAEQWTFQVGIFFFARILLSQGAVTYAAHTTVVSIDSLSFLPGIGFGIATTILVGQNLGAKRPDLAELYAITACKMGVAFMVVMGASFFFFPAFFVGLLIDDPRVIEAATPALRIAGLFDPIVGFGFIMTGALRGGGDTKFPLYVRMLSSILVRVGLAYLFIQVLGFGLIGARLAMALDFLLIAVLVSWRFKSGVWKTMWKERNPVIAKSIPDTKSSEVAEVELAEAAPVLSTPSRK